jgi:hypothetical protein
MTLVEECAGTGELTLDAQVRRVRYRISRYQGMAPSGMPIPGLHRIEGSVALDNGADWQGWIGELCDLRLEDGRLLRILVMDADGRILSEGHGPMKCSCC